MRGNFYGVNKTINNRPSACVTVLCARTPGTYRRLIGVDALDVFYIRSRLAIAINTRGSSPSSPLYGATLYSP